MNKNIPSLELCKKLKELGRNYETELFYCKDNDEKDEDAEVCGPAYGYAWSDFPCYSGSEVLIPCPTIGEMMEVLPRNIRGNYLTIEKCANGFDVYYKNSTGILVYEYEEMLADALANCTIWLIKNKYLDLNKK